MKIIFLKDVKNQAKKDEIKDVKDGYAKYLIAQNIAVAYSQTSLNVLKSELNEKAKEEETKIKKCNEIKQKLEKLSLEFKVKTGQEDKVFGSISSKQISEKLSELGFNIDKKKILLSSDINSLGTHIVQINLHKKVTSSLKINLIK